MSEYKRLTRYSGKVMQEDCRNCNYAYNNVCNYKDKENKIIYDIDEDCKKVMLNRLAELEDKIMDGTLVEFPVKGEYELFGGGRMNKQKQIEGMATELSNSSDKHGYDLKECEIDLLALDLYNAGYHKVPDNAVVLTDIDLADRTYEIRKRAQEETRKETAEEIYSKMYDFAYRTKSYYTDALNDIIAKIDETFNDFRIELESLLRKYGVEVEG